MKICSIKLENHLCSVEFSEKLKEAGLKQKIFFYYIPCGYSNFIESYDIISYSELKTSGIRHKNNFSAFMTSELFEIIPDCINFGKKYYFMEFIKINNEDGICYRCTYGCIYEIYSTKITDCLAKMIVKLIENNFIGLEYINISDSHLAEFSRKNMK